MVNKKRTWHFSNYSSRCVSLFSHYQRAGTPCFTDISFTLSHLLLAPNIAAHLGAGDSPDMQDTEHNTIAGRLLTLWYMSESNTASKTKKKFKKENPFIICSIELPLPGIGIPLIRFLSSQSSEVANHQMVLPKIKTYKTNIHSLKPRNRFCIKCPTYLTYPQKTNFQVQLPVPFEIHYTPILLHN